MELIDVYDENNNSLGYSLDRAEVHQRNVWHYHVSAWIMNNDGKILLQQRAFTKKKNPGKWSKTGGHVDAGENCKDAIKREVYEEIGLAVNDNEIKYIETYKSTNPKEHCFSVGYILFTNMKEDEFVLQKEEVNKVKYYSIEEIERIRKQNNKDYTFCNWEDEGFNKQIRLLKKYREIAKKHY